MNRSFDYSERIWQDQTVFFVCFGRLEVAGHHFAKVYIPSQAYDSVTITRTLSEFTKPFDFFLETL